MPPNIQALFEKKAREIQADITQKYASDKHNELSPLLANELTARYGFKSTQALIDYLKSPGGKAEKSLCLRILAKLEALYENGLHMAQAKQQERALMMCLLGLAYRKEAAAERLEHILEQKLIDKQLDQAKTINQHAQTSLDSYTESAEALSHALAEHAFDIDELHAEWDAFDESAHAHETHDLFDRLLADDVSHHEAFKTPTLQLLRQEHKAVHKNGHIYLIAKNTELGSLSLEAQHTAKNAFRNLPRPLVEAMHLKRQKEAEQLEKRQFDLIQRSTPKHQDIRALSQQLTLVHEAIDKLKNQKKPTYHDHAVLTKSYKLLAREVKHTNTKKQNAPLLKIMKEDLEVNIDRINAMGGPQMGQWLHEFRQGTVKTASHQTQRQTMLSLLRHKDELSAYIAEAYTSQVSKQELQKNTPQPRPTHAPEPEENTKRAKFNPTPFSDKPF